MSTKKIPQLNNRTPYEVTRLALEELQRLEESPVLAVREPEKSAWKLGVSIIAKVFVRGDLVRDVPIRITDYNPIGEHLRHTKPFKSWGEVPIQNLSVKNLRTMSQVKLRIEDIIKTTSAAHKRNLDKEVFEKRKPPFVNKHCSRRVH